MNKRFKGNQLNLNWSESFTNFIQTKTGNEVDIMNPPIIVSDDYKIMSIENVISEHPNYYTIEELSFNSGELKKMNPELRNIAITNGILIIKSHYAKIRKRKLN